MFQVAHIYGTARRSILKTSCKNYINQDITAKIAIGDTIGAAWAMARFGSRVNIIPPNEQINQLLSLPPEALRINPGMAARLHQLGLRQIRQFIGMPRRVLQRRFTGELLQRMDHATGVQEEYIQPVVSPVEWQERLPCLELIITRTGIEIALQQLLELLCARLNREQKGIRQCIFKTYRIDHAVLEITIGTHRGSVNAKHLFKLFEEKLSGIDPGMGIELFVLEAPVVEDISAIQKQMWNNAAVLSDHRIAELLDRLSGRIGSENIYRYFPDEHYWPERSVKKVHSLQQKMTAPWMLGRPRPLYLLPSPQPIQVAAPVPDYPPMMFRYKNILHTIVKADGPERIEREWWMDSGDHRDYYTVEDEKGQRYWLFRSGHYTEEAKWKWFVHGFFA